MTTVLSVNLNAVALLRNRRDLPWPSVIQLGQIALEAGAHGLTVHPRPDERHTRRQDCYDLKALVEKHPVKELNLEGYPSEDFLSLVESVKPDQATLVPDDPNQATSDHGWDINRHGDRLEPVIARLKGHGIRVSLFIDADPSQPGLAKNCGADRVELYTGPYGACFNDEAGAGKEIEKLQSTAEAADKVGLGVNAGHDLTLDNLPPLVEAIPFLAEVSIGHGLTADCLIYGMAETVKRYKTALEL